MIIFSTPKQSKMYHFIKEYTLENGYAPTHEEIAKHLGNSTHGSIGLMAEKLKEEGHIEYIPGKNRGIRIVSKD